MNSLRLPLVPILSMTYFDKARGQRVSLVTLDQLLGELESFMTGYECPTELLFQFQAKQVVYSHVRHNVQNVTEYKRSKCMRAFALITSKIVEFADDLL